MSFVIIPPPRSESLSDILAGSNTSLTRDHSTANLSKSNNVLFTGFNLHASMVAIGTEQGFKIFSCAYGHFRKEFDLKFIDGGISFVSFMDKDKDSVALVGGGSRPAFSMNKIVFYNYKERRVTNELICSRNVISVHSKKDIFVAVAEDMIFIYDIRNRQPIHALKTAINHHGLFAMVYLKDRKQFLMAYPDETCSDGPLGNIKLIWLCSSTHKILQESVIHAHESSIRCFSLSDDGTMFSTTSEKGTIVRVFNTDSGDKKIEFKRGALTSDVYSLCFSHDGAFLACMSSNGTLHIFVVDYEAWKKQRLLAQGQTDSSWTSTLWDYVPSSITSSLEATPKSVFRYKNIEGISVCAFESTDDSILLCTNKGVYMSLKFDWNCSGSENINEAPTDKYVANID